MTGDVLSVLKNSLCTLYCRYKGVGGGLVKTPNVSPVKNNKVSPRAARSPSRSPVKGRTKSTGRLESAMQVANEERDFYKEEYLRLVSYHYWS